MRASMFRYLPFLAFLAGCQCGPFGIDATRFVCKSQADCLDGFECRDLGAGLECVKTGTADAGTPDAGRVDAGLVDAGDPDAGGDAGNMDAGLDAGLDAGFDAGFDAGLDAGLDAGPMDAGAVGLSFVTPPQTIAINGCTAAMTIQTVNAAGATWPVDTLITVGLQANPAVGVSFWGTSTCTGLARTSVTIAAGQSSATFYASSTTSRLYTVTVSSPPLSPASQPLTVVIPPNSLVFTSTPPSPVRGGTCLTATVEARRLGVAAPVAGPTTIGLTVAPAGGALFYSDATCSAATTTATTMAAGASTATFYVKPLTGGANAITAAAPFGSANQTITTTPIVRRGECFFDARTSLPDGGFTSGQVTNCAVAPAVTSLGASLLITQSTSVVSGVELGVAQARCHLTTTSNVICNRREDFDPGSVHFQVAEVPQGMTVQQRSSSLCAGTWTLTPVNPSSTFVLKSASNTTLAFDDEDALVATLTNPTTVTIFPTLCNGYDLQVVDWAGITVERGTLDAGAGAGMASGVASTTLTGLPVASLNRAVLVQAGIGSTSTRSVCTSMVRGALPTASSIAFTRTSGDAGCPNDIVDSLSFERIDFGGRATVREYTQVFTPGVRAVPVTINPVDTTRTLVFASSQVSSGQGVGETDSPSFSLFVESAFQLVLTGPTTVTATREVSNSTAIVTFYVAELLP